MTEFLTFWKRPAPYNLTGPIIKAPHGAFMIGPRVRYPIVAFSFYVLSLKGVVGLLRRVIVCATVDTQPRVAEQSSYNGNQ